MNKKITKREYLLIAMNYQRKNMQIFNNSMKTMRRITNKREYPL